ncbi:hypothetical protein [Streptomyces sp. NPDC088725]|uniref:hypothetical protein n=1 Tax=Streptomyces sp. NPDC088725 TaxID=3365873 RepID=UPI00381DE232
MSSSWSDLAVQAVGALTGTIAGGAITVLVARWQTAKAIVAQTDLASAQQAADARLARVEREHERSSEAARQLLERLADLHAWLPSLPDVAAEPPRLSATARDSCRTAMESLRRGMHTELFGIGQGEARDRCRALVKLTYDAGWRQEGQDHPTRVVRDIRNCLRYVQFSLEAVIDGRPLPSHAEPPVLERDTPEMWLPPEIPGHWGDPADLS